MPAHALWSTTTHPVWQLVGGCPVGGYRHHNVDKCMLSHKFFFLLETFPTTLMQHRLGCISLSLRSPCSSTHLAILTWPSPPGHPHLFIPTWPSPPGHPHMANGHPHLASQSDCGMVIWMLVTSYISIGWLFRPQYCIFRWARCWFVKILTTANRWKQVESGGKQEAIRKWKNSPWCDAFKKRRLFIIKEEKPAKATVRIDGNC